MSILFCGLILFSLAFCLHLLAWKIRIPKGQTSVLLLIFSATLLAGLCGLWLASESCGVRNIFMPQKASDYLHIALFFISLALVYIATYPAIEVDSPSLLIVNKIAEAGSSGLDKNKLAKVIDDDLLVKPRIHDLLSDKLVYFSGDKYKLTGRGRLIAGIFCSYRKLLKATKGG